MLAVSGREHLWSAAGSDEWLGVFLFVTILAVSSGESL